MKLYLYGVFGAAIIRSYCILYNIQQYINEVNRIDDKVIAILVEANSIGFLYLV